MLLRRAGLTASAGLSCYPYCGFFVVFYCLLPNSILDGALPPDPDGGAYGTPLCCPLAEFRCEKSRKGRERKDFKGEGRDTKAVGKEREGVGKNIEGRRCEGKKIRKERG